MISKNNKFCCGHDVHNGNHVDCGKKLSECGIVSGRALRCSTCKKAQLLFNRHKFLQRHGAQLRGKRGSSLHTVQVHRVTILCKTCRNLAHRRSPQGCRGCGLPYVEDRPTPRVLLSSCMGYALNLAEE